MTSIARTLQPTDDELAEDVRARLRDLPGVDGTRIRVRVDRATTSTRTPRCAARRCGRDIWSR